MTEQETLYRKIFVFYGCEDDAKWFRWKIYSEARDSASTPIAKLCRNLIHERVGFGKDTHYLRYNVKSGKLFLDRSFLRWVKLTREDIFEEVINETLDKYEEANEKEFVDLITFGQAKVEIKNK